MARLSMTIPADHGGAAVVVLSDLLPHGGIFVDSCGGGEGGGAPMNPHSGSSGVSVDPCGDGNDNRWSPCGVLGTVLAPAFLSLRSGVPVDPHGNHRICRAAGQV